MKILGGRAFSMFGQSKPIQIVKFLKNSKKTLFVIELTITACYTLNGQRIF
jgi:hypothetical protein